MIKLETTALHAARRYAGRMESRFRSRGQGKRRGINGEMTSRGVGDESRESGGRVAGEGG